MNSKMYTAEYQGDPNTSKSPTESKIGPSVGLSVINRVHGLSDADWDKLKELPGRNGKPTFDYKVASDGSNIIQVENKGSYVDDNRKKSSAISNHKKNIKDKKRKIASLEAQNNYPYPAALRYGTITAVDSRTNTVAKCLHHVLTTVLRTLIHRPNALKQPLQRALSYLADNATRAKPQRDKKSGRLKLGLVHVHVAA